MFDFFRCRNLLLETASKILYIGVVDQLTYLFLRKASLYRQRQEREQWRTKRLLHINSVRFLKRIIGDIPIYSRAAEKELSALKRGFYIKRAKENRKKHSHVTERHYQSSVVIKRRKTTIYRHREQNST